MRKPCNGQGEAKKKGGNALDSLVGT